MNPYYIIILQFLVTILGSVGVIKFIDFFKLVFSAKDKIFMLGDYPVHVTSLIAIVVCMIYTSLIELVTVLFSGDPFSPEKFGVLLLACWSASQRLFKDWKGMNNVQ